jgi:hypothetical protein
LSQSVRTRAYQSIIDVISLVTSDDSATPGAVISVQTFGDFQNFNPHLHIIATDGCFSGDGVFQVGYSPNPKDLEELFRYEILKMLKKEGKITDAVMRPHHLAA